MFSSWFNQLWGLLRYLLHGNVERAFNIKYLHKIKKCLPTSSSLNLICFIVWMSTFSYQFWRSQKLEIKSCKKVFFIPVLNSHKPWTKSCELFQPSFELATNFSSICYDQIRTDIQKFIFYKFYCQNLL